jgi:hypothetical protein
MATAHRPAANVIAMKLRFRLRTLLIVLAVGPPLTAGVWFSWQEWRAHQAIEALNEHYASEVSGVWQSAYKP